VYYYHLLAYDLDPYLSTTRCTFFEEFFFKFCSLNVTILTLTNTVTFQYICLALQGDQCVPLVYLESDGHYTQVGIVSFYSSAGCRVTIFLNWISSATGPSFG